MTNTKFLLTHLLPLIAAILFFHPVAAQEDNDAAAEALDSADYGPTPLLSMDQGHVQMFSVPPPRGTVTTVGGHPIAVSKASRRLTVRLPALGDTIAEISLALRSLPAPLASVSSLDLPDEEAISKHLKNRPWLPCAISGGLSEEELEALKEYEFPAGFTCETAYRREYPQGSLFAHAVGYIGDEMARQHGPISETEYLWSPVIGRSGLEKTLNKELTGKPGEVNRLYSVSAELLHHELSRERTPGQTVVTSLNLELQRLAATMLEKTGRPGAFVAVDAETGDILAMCSYPSFDPNLFIPRISHEKFREIAEDAEAPFFDRAVTGAYPPGSTWKPFVALAGMKHGVVDGIETLFPGPAKMDIGGREFKNWSDVPEGPMDLRYALTRSTNTWFYQAGLKMGSGPIIEVAEAFGFGVAPDLPLPAVGKGNLPDAGEEGPQYIANVSIGQGAILVSPLQLALAMAGLANGGTVPKPRLVRALQDPITKEIITEYGVETSSCLSFDEKTIELVREGMWGVVNHKRGTAAVASMRVPAVFGKTGTSQWAVDGEPRSLAWFAGWVDANSPRIAFAAVSHGRSGEMLGGGKNAAPIASGFLKTAYKSPEKYAVTKPDALLTRAPKLALPLVEKPEDAGDLSSAMLAMPVETDSKNRPFAFLQKFLKRRQPPATESPDSSRAKKRALFRSDRRGPSSD